MSVSVDDENDPIVFAIIVKEVESVVHHTERVRIGVAGHNDVGRSQTELCPEIVEVSRFGLLPFTDDKHTIVWFFLTYPSASGFTVRHVPAPVAFV